MVKLDAAAVAEAAAIVEPLRKSRRVADVAEQLVASGGFAEAG
jgi:hypothetical protein